MRAIYKIASAAEWRAAETRRVFEGAAIDLTDGYIHFSTAEQVQETANKHFAGQKDLVLVAVDADALGSALKWEPSRGGALFPHLYGALRFENVLAVTPLRTNAAGEFVFDSLLS